MTGLTITSSTSTSSSAPACATSPPSNEIDAYSSFKTSSHTIDQGTFDKMRRLCNFLIKSAKNSEAQSIASACLRGENMTRLNEITLLDLTSAHLASIPDEIEMLPNLIVLNLTNNSISSLPETIVKLQRLATLNLDGNQFSKIPPEIKQMEQLKCLHVYDNPIKRIPIAYRDIIVTIPYTSQWSAI